MPEISRLRLPSGNTYDIRDDVARTYYAEVSVTFTRDSETEEVTYSASIVSGTFAEIEAAMDAGRDVIVKAVYSSGSGEAHYFRPGYRVDGSELHFESAGDELLDNSYMLNWFPAHNGEPERVIFNESSSIYGAMDDGSTGNAVTSITQGVDVIGKHILTVHKDKTFVDTAAQTLTSSQKAQARTNIGVDEAIADAMKGGYVAVNTLPTASEQTMGHIYLIPGTSGTGQNIKIEYVTIRSGSEGAYTYTWEELGTTELNLDNLSLAKGSGDNVLGESTTFTVSKPNINITGGSSDTFVKSYPGTTSKLVTDTVPNVTSVGSASTWAFQMGTGIDATTLIISGANGSAPTLGTAKTVATGGIASNGGGSDVMTGLGTPTTASAVTGVGSAALASNPTVTVGTNDRIKIAKYDDLDLVKP